MFSRGTSRANKQLVLGVLGIPRESRNERYLGLPVHIGAARSREFRFLKDKIWLRIQGWKEKLLSKAGKEILIKAVALAIPTYAMSCFDLTKALCEEISAMICRYWWNNQEDKNKCHWVSWEQLSRSKDDGGLGFRDLHIFNMAMLARQGWRMLQSQDSLCCQVLKALYYPNTSILEAVPKDGMSYTWRSILRGVELLKQGIIWRIGTGEEVDAFDDPWIPRGSTRRPRTHNILNEKMRVCDLIDQTTVTWDEELIKSLFDEEDAKEILSIPLRPKMEDWVAWHYDKKGEFSVKSAYRLGVSIRDAQLIADASSSISTEPKNKVWSKLWNLKLPGKVKIFSWRLCQNSPPTRMNIKRKRVELDTRCPMCYRMDEDGGHLFLKCKCVKHIWRCLLLEDVRQFLLSAPNATAMFESIWTLPSNTQSMVLVLFWDWWTTRNKKSAEGKERTVEETCHIIQRHWVDFQIKPGGESKGTISNIMTAKLEDRWSKPQENWVS
jgi:hypothetical protein